MAFYPERQQKIRLNLTRNLTPQQIRLIKQFNHALRVTLTTEYEDEYFELSAEFENMRLLLNRLILHANMKNITQTKP